MKGDHRQPYGNTFQYYITLLLPAQSTTQLLVYVLPEPRDPQDLPALLMPLTGGWQPLLAYYFPRDRGIISDRVIVCILNQQKKL